MNSLSSVIFTLESQYPTLYSHMSSIPPAVDHQYETFDSSYHSASNSSVSELPLIIDDDDEDLAGYRLVKKQKMNDAEAHSIAPQRNSNKVRVSDYDKVPARCQSQKSISNSKSHLCGDIPSSKKFEPDFLSMCKTLLAISNMSNTKQVQTNPNANLYTDAYNTQSCIQQDMSDLILKNMSSVSTDAGSARSQTSEINTVETSPNYEEQSDEEIEYKWESPVLSIDAADDIFDEVPNKSINEIPFATIPALDTKTIRKERARRPLISIWSPECIGSQLINECLGRLSQLLNQDVTNEEKAVKLLIKYNMNLDEALKEVLRNKTFYRNHFKSDQRVLRGRIPLF